MSILSDFEDRVAGAVEGLFAGAFRSPVQPAELAKALAKAMDDGRVVGVGKVYAPVSYLVALSEEDQGKLGTFTSTLGGELATYLSDHARERGYDLTDKPHVRFITHEDLRLGRFRVSAELATGEAGKAFSAPPVEAERAVVDRPPSALSSMATVTVGETHHDVALRGEQVVVGRLSDCDICLSDANASRRHAAFAREGDGWTIDDLGSTNGTYLGGEQVTGPVRLRDGDVVEIGLTRLTYHEPKG